MALFRRAHTPRNAGAVRWFFATDVHGSERCFRKFLAAGRTYQASTLILGGDVAGKAIVPLTRQDDGRYLFRRHGRDEFVTATHLDATLEQLKDSGLYPVIMSGDEVARLGSDHTYRTRLFERLITEQVENWCGLAATRLEDNIRCIITPGNDDLWCLDEVLRKAERVECPERECISVGRLVLASLGNANRTPWDTEREFDEEELEAQIDQMLAHLDNTARLVVNFHVPPYASGLDTAAAIDDQFNVVIKNGRPVESPVGSTAVRAAIARYRPVVGLHGHIHEAPGVWKNGRTVCLNPGSDYASGVLKGALVQFDADGRYLSHLLTTG